MFTCLDTRNVFIQKNAFGVGVTSDEDNFITNEVIKSVSEAGLAKRNVCAFAQSGAKGESFVIDLTLFQKIITFQTSHAIRKWFAWE